MNKPTTEELLRAERYTLLAEVPHAELIPFIQENIRHKNPVTIGYIAINLMVLLGIALGVDWMAGRKVTDPLLTYASFGIVLSFTVIIVLHEWIHGITYHLAGAQNVSYGGNWRKLIFYALADHFVADSRDFTKISLAPFVVLNGMALAGWLLTSGPVTGLFMSVLVIHTAACSGDFALLSFFWRHRHRRVFTFDDARQQKSYFFAAT
jgi:hypothetical protein